MVAGVILSVASYNQSEPDIKISDIFRDQMMKFLESAGELDASSGQGVNFIALEQQLAKTKSSYELVAATWPEGFEQIQ